MPYLDHLKSLRNERPRADRNKTVLQPRTVIVLAILWGCALLVILAIIAHRDWENDRVENLNKLLQTHCANWSVTYPASFLPHSEPIITKCLPK